MNITLSFAQFLVSSGTCQSLGTDLFIGRAPSTNKALDALWWIKSGGGTIVSKNSTGETLKNYSVEIYYRDFNEGTVYEKLQELEELLNCDGCTQLEGYTTIEITATSFPVDNDLDNEERKIGLVTATLKVYKTC